MNVFVLSTGRCGSTTVARAFAHTTSFTAGHETRATLIRDRLSYPENHIECDNRLSWFLGGLEHRYGDRAHWVHLTRDPEQVIDSYHRRWEDKITTRRPGELIRHPRRSRRRFREWRKDPTSMNRVAIGPAFAYGIVLSRDPLDEEERREAVALYVQTVNDNISQFLAGKPNVSHIALEDLERGFSAAWGAIGAEGPLPDALRELETRHNANPVTRSR